MLKSLILASLLVQNVAFGQQTEANPEFSNLTPVTETAMKLVGKGVRDRSTGENIALACVDQNCDELRFIYFSAKGEAFYLSRSFKIKLRDDQPSDEQALQNFVRDFGKLSKGLKRNRTSDDTRSWRGMAVYGTGAVGGIIIGVSGAFILGGALFLAAVIPVTTISIIKGPDNLDKMDFITPLFQSTYGAFNPSHSSQLSKAEGWNWSSKPKNVTHSAFQWIAVAAKDADILTSEAVPNQASYEAYPQIARMDITAGWSRVHDLDNRGLKVESLGEVVAILDKMEAELAAHGVRLILDPKPKRKESIYTIDAQFMAEYIVNHNTSVEAYLQPAQERAIQYQSFFDSASYQFPALKGLSKYKDYKQRAWAYNSFYFKRIRK